MTTRHLVPIIADIWSDVCSDSTHDQDVKAMLHALAGMGEALEETGYVLSGEAQADFERCGNEFLVFYRALHIEAKNTNTKRWHETPKFHYLQHIIALSRYMSPRQGWCYPDEDFMRIMKATNHLRLWNDFV